VQGHDVSIPRDGLSRYDFLLDSRLEARVYINDYVRVAFTLIIWVNGLLVREGMVSFGLT